MTSLIFYMSNDGRQNQWKWMKIHEKVTFNKFTTNCTQFIWVHEKGYKSSTKRAINQEKEWKYYFQKLLPQNVCNSIFVLQSFESAVDLQNPPKWL